MEVEAGDLLKSSVVPTDLIDVAIFHDHKRWVQGSCPIHIGQLNPVCTDTMVSTMCDRQHVNCLASWWLTPLTHINIECRDTSSNDKLGDML